MCTFCLQRRYMFTEDETLTFTYLLNNRHYLGADLRELSLKIE